MNGDRGGALGVLDAAVSANRGGGTVTITIGDGSDLNALTTRDWRAIELIARDLADDPTLQCVVIVGRGGVFCSGSDLNEWDVSSAQQVDASFEQMERAFRAVEALPVPTVAYVERVAAGAGCQLALACDLQLVSATARIGMPVTRLGILVPAAFASRLALRVGPSRAKALLFNGTLCTADEAYGMGLVTHVAQPGAARDQLAELQAIWAGIPVEALRTAKRATDDALSPLTQPLAAEPPAARTTAEFAGRVRAFLAKRRAGR